MSVKTFRKCKIDANNLVPLLCGGRDMTWKAGSENGQARAVSEKLSVSLSVFYKDKLNDFPVRYLEQNALKAWRGIFSQKISIAAC